MSRPCLCQEFWNLILKYNQTHQGFQPITEEIIKHKKTCKQCEWTPQSSEYVQKVTGLHAILRGDKDMVQFAVSLLPEYKQLLNQWVEQQIANFQSQISRDESKASA
jgi:hypothetical protein